MARGRKPKKRYFDDSTQDAIVLYNKCEDIDVKNAIYEKDIHKAFTKLAQNLIHTFKFYYTEVDDLTHLQHELVIFMMSKMHMFDPSLGFKAFSYFGTIGKRWLIIYNQKNYNKLLKSDVIDNTSATFNTKDEYYTNDVPRQLTYESVHTSGENTNDEKIEFLDRYVKYCTDNIYMLFATELEVKVADCILELFRKREYITIYNKKALYIYIKEMMRVKSIVITKVSKQLHDIYKKHYNFYTENDYYDF